jgi:hypothetical protein
MEEARSIVDRRVEVARFRTVAEQLLGDTRGTLERFTNVEERKAFRREGLRELTPCVRILAGLNEVLSLLGSCAALDTVKRAAETSNLELVQRAAESVWASDGGQRGSLSECLGKERRPKALMVIGELAPLLGSTGTPGEIVNIVQGIRNVCRWWP